MKSVLVAGAKRRKSRELALRTSRVGDNIRRSICLPNHYILMLSLLITTLLLQLNSSSDCNNAPQLADRLLQEAARLGIQVMQGNPELPGKDASYRAMHGRPGIILISPRPMGASTRCQLITHEMIHVLQHFKRSLKGVDPIGLGTTAIEALRHSQPQEAEAYSNQNKPLKILELLQKLKRP